MDLDVLLQLLIGCIVVFHCSDARCLYGEGPDCFYKCHCLDNTECGGSCPSGCDTAALGYNWGGQACQIGNVALYKAADQSGKCISCGGDGFARQGVDGKLPTSNVENCAHPDENRGQWWVDLGGLFQVFNVTIYFRISHCCDSWNSQFTISVRNSSTESAECAYQHDAVTDYSKTFTCHKPLVGREVHFIRKAGSTNQDYFVLCEVIVMGHQYTDCSMCPAGVYCDDVTGCLECDGAYQPECEQECDNFYYGTNCLSECGRCNDNVACDKSSGICPEGCQVWWITDQCQLEIAKAVPDNATVDVQETTYSSISVSWQKVNVSEDIVNHYGYQVRATKTGVMHYAVEELVMHQRYDGLFEIGALRYNTYYVLEVTPYRMWGNTTNMGTPYTKIIQKTRCTNPEKPTIPNMILTTVSSGEALRITHQNISSINSKCNAITAVWLRIYIDEDEIASIVINMEGTAYTFPLHESGSYKALITIRNNEGLSSNSDISTTIWYGTTTTDTYKPGYETTTTDMYKPGYETTATDMYKPDGDGNSIVIPWAMFGVAVAIVTALIIAIVVIIMNQKRQTEKLKQQLRGRQSATDDQDQGSDVHLDEIHIKPEVSVKGQGRELRASPPQTQPHDRSVQGQGRELPVSPPQTQHHDQTVQGQGHHDRADYEEVGTGMVAPPDISHQYDAVNPDAGSGQYDGLRGGVYGNSQITGPYEMMSV